MTLLYLASNVISGVSGDTKPTSIPTNSFFLETDTGTTYIWNGSAWVALSGEGKANVFTDNQVIKSDEDRMLHIYRPNSTVVTSISEISLAHDNSTPAETALSSMLSRLATNTAGSEDTDLEFWVHESGNWVRAGMIDHNGDLTIRSTGTTGFTLGGTGLTGARTFTFPDVSGQLLTDNISTSDLQDVSISGPVRGEVVKYDGSNWSNDIGSSNDGIITKNGEWYPLSTTDVGTGLLSASMTTSSESALSRTTDSTGRYTEFDESTGSTTRGLKQDISLYRRELGSRFFARISSGTFNSNTRFWCGFSDTSTALSSDTPFDAGVSGIVVAAQLITGVTQTNMKVYHNDTTGSTVVADTGVSLLGNSSRHNIEIVLSSSDAKVYVDDSLTNTITTDLPAASTDLYPHWEMQRNGGGQKTFRIYKAAVITR